ncbi:MAG: hypothetical protein JWO86_5561 [Myxococcaceae bacterium]|jgi:hypothetical protein|nr:hypothetical protein [Myxococcaceae bacterium]
MSLAWRPRAGGGCCIAASCSRLFTCRFNVDRFARVLARAFAPAFFAMLTSGKEASQGPCAPDGTKRLERLADLRFS